MPKRQKQMRTKSIQLSDETWEKLAKQAEHESTSVSAIVRRLIKLGAESENAEIAKLQDEIKNLKGLADFYQKHIKHLRETSEEYAKYFEVEERTAEGYANLFARKSPKEGAESE